MSTFRSLSLALFHSTFLCICFSLSCPSRTGQTWSLSSRHTRSLLGSLFVCAAVFLSKTFAPFCVCCYCYAMHYYLSVCPSLTAAMTDSSQEEERREEARGRSQTREPLDPSQPPPLPACAFMRNTLFSLSAGKNHMLLRVVCHCAYKYIYDSLPHLLARNNRRVPVHLGHVPLSLTASMNPE